MIPSLAGGDEKATRAQRRVAAVEAAAKTSADMASYRMLARQQLATMRRDSALMIALRDVSERNEAHHLRTVELRLARAMSEHADAERSRRLRLAVLQEAQVKEAFEQVCRSERDWLLAAKQAAKSSRPTRPPLLVPPPPDFGARGTGSGRAGGAPKAVGRVKGAFIGGGETAAERRARAVDGERQLFELLASMSADEEAALERASCDPVKAKALRERLVKMLV